MLRSDFLNRKSLLLLMKRFCDMKNTRLHLFLLSFLPLIVCAQTPSEQLVADQKVFDFGEVQEKDGVVSHTFVFTNTSNKLVAIEDTYSGCGCATSNFNKEPIPPGKTREVTITFNPRNRPGFFSKEIAILFNNKTNYTRIWIKGTVTPFLHPVEEDHPYSFGKGLYCSLQVLAFGKISKGKSDKIDMYYANDTNQEVELTFVVEGNNPNLTYTNPDKIAAKGRGKMRFTYTSTSIVQKELVFNLYPCVNGKKLSKPLVVKVTETNESN